MKLIRKCTENRFIRPHCLTMGSSSCIGYVRTRFRNKRYWNAKLTKHKSTLSPVLTISSHMNWNPVMSCDVCWLHFPISCKWKLKWYPRSKYQYLTVILASCSPNLCLFMFLTLLYLFLRLTFHILCILLHILAAARIPPLCDQLSNIKFSTKKTQKYALTCA